MVVFWELRPVWALQLVSGLVLDLGRWAIHQLPFSF
jgi:hypothetical protein